MVFAIYSIAGHLASLMYNSFLKKNKVVTKRGKGPYSATYGIGGVIMLFAGSYFGENIFVIFTAGFAIGTVLEIAAGEITNLISGVNRFFYKAYHSLLWGLLAVVAVFHWNEILIVIIRCIPPWVHMIFLVLLFYNMVTGYIDGMSQLYERKKMRKNNGIKDI